jgi:cobalt-zinc-cadmium efflux system membrane fusion protein
LLIEEEDAPPVFVAWVYDEHGTLVAPNDVSLVAQVHRFAGRLDTITFRAMGNHLRGDSIVREPHSFVTELALTVAGRKYEFQYEQREFRVTLTPEAVHRAKITTQAVAARHIDPSVKALDGSQGSIMIKSFRIRDSVSMPEQLPAGMVSVETDG